MVVTCGNVTRQLNCVFCAGLSCLAIPLLPRHAQPGGPH
jgi:hypothetical protein